jgi:hypothetical protein
MMRVMRVVMAAAALASAACSEEAPTAAAALAVPDGATNVRSERGFGVDGVEYDLPAGDGNAVVAAIHQRLLREGFKPTAELWVLSAPRSSSFSGGWQCFPVSVEHLQQGLRYQWIADWRNDAGDVVTYTVGCSPLPPRCERIDVAAHVMPASRVQQDRPNPVIDREPPSTISPDCEKVRLELERRLREAS